MTGLAGADLSHIPVSQGLSATLARASDGARAGGAAEVSLEHMLAALCDDEDAADVLAASRIDPARLKGEVISYLVHNEERPPGPQPRPVAVSQGLMRILEAAAAAARGGRRRDINGAIVLAAIVGDGQSAAAQILQNHGLTFDNAIRALQSAMAQPRSASPEVAPAEDVLARARERVQSRAAPTLREIMLERPKAALAPPQTDIFPIERPALDGGGGASAQWEPAFPEAGTQREAAAASPPATGAAAQEERGPETATNPVAPEAARSSGLVDKAPQPPEQQPQVAAPPQVPQAPAEPDAPAPQTSTEASVQASPAAPPGLERLDTGAPPQGFGQASAPPPAQPQQAPFPGAAPAPQQPPFRPQPSYPTMVPGPPAGDFATRAPHAPAPPPSPQLPYGAPPMPPSPQVGFERPRAAGPQPPPIPPALPPRAQPHAPAGYGAPVSVRAPQPQPQRPGPLSVPQAHAQAPAPGTARSPAVPQKRDAQPAAEIGQLAENVPRSMRVGITERVEVRIGRAQIEGLTEGMDGGGLAWQHEVTVTKAMSVRIRAPEGGFFIETASPETQWIDNQFGTGDDFASWRFLITPNQRGWSELQIVVSARTVGGDGLAAETAFPDQVIEVKVRTNYARAFARTAGWIAAALAGGAIAKFGEGAVAIGANLLSRFTG